MAARGARHCARRVRPRRRRRRLQRPLRPYNPDADREEQWLPSIAAVRTAVADADHRFLYLLWLLAAQDDAVDPDTVEPPLPAGLAKLDEPLSDLCTFLRLDRDLVAAAAEPFPGPAAPTGGTDLAAGIARLDLGVKHEVLHRLLHSGGREAAADLRRHLHAQGPAPRPATMAAARTAAAIRAACEHHRQLRLEQEARRKADRRERRLQAEREAQDQRVAKLQGHEDQAWRRVDTLVAAMKAGPYDEAAVLVTDLAALARKIGTYDAFTHRYRHLRMEHSRKKAFLTRLDDAGL